MNSVKLVTYRLILSGTLKKYLLTSGGQVTMVTVPYTMIKASINALV